MNVITKGKQGPVWGTFIKYSFIYLVVLSLSCGPQALPCVRQDLSLWHMDSLAMVQNLEHMDSVVTGSA